MDTVYGLSECVTFLDGKRIVIHRDQVWDANDPVVKALPQFFTDAPSKVQSTVEQATAKPGEKRNTRRGN